MAAARNCIGVRSLNWKGRTVTDARQRITIAPLLTLILFVPACSLAPKAPLWEPSPASRAAEKFDYFQNSWSVIGLKDYKDGTRITPSNELVLAGGRKVRIRFGRELTALSREQVKTNLEGWMPIIQLRAVDGQVQYDFTFWATPLTSVPDWKAAFNWPVAGEDYLNWVSVAVTNTGATAAPAKIRIELVEGDNVRGNTQEWTVQPGVDHAVVGIAHRFPFHAAAEESKVSGEEARLWLERTREWWRDTLASAARIVVPEVKATQALLAAHVCQLIALDHGEIHGGEGFYDRFYARDGAYQIMELEEAGLMDIARKAIALYLKYQRPDGRFESQKGQLDANGQSLWALWQFYQITGDKAWLAEVYPQMRRAAEWTIKARREAPADSPFAGLLPNALADGEYLWDGQYHIVGYDFWNLRGLLCTAEAARALGRVEEADELAREADDYRAAIDAAWKRTGLPHFPPSWEKVGTHWGNTETLWPTPLFTPDDPRVSALIREVRERHGGGFCEGTIRWTGFPGAIHPYMSAYTTMAALERGESEQVIEDFYWYLLHSTATHAFPEGVFYKRRFAWSDTIPHATGASNYAILLRHMLIHERGDELHLLPAVPEWWFGPGERIEIENAPTHFGLVSLRVVGRGGGLEVDLKLPTERPASRVVLHLPASRRLLTPLQGVEVVTAPPQKKRWTFATVVELYNRTAPPLGGKIEGLVHLPADPPLSPGAVKMLNLSAAANTDPFKAPFGKENPGKYLFTGLPTGTQVCAGVPFTILDPSKNEGRGLVVLHSPQAPQDRTWPKEVVIPVGEAGKRLYFLGNVHGWAPDDPGEGEWGAVAEYIIRYADGESQTVPLITGRTTEEWTASPSASDVFCALRGDPWHLNVLGVELRPVKVESIVFHDRGTPAAPVLVAVTLER